MTRIRVGVGVEFVLEKGMVWVGRTCRSRKK